MNSELKQKKIKLNNLEKQDYNKYIKLKEDKIKEKK